MAKMEAYLSKLEKEENVIGYLKGVSALSVLQAMELDQKNCTLLIHHLKTDAKGGIVIRNGQIIHAWNQHAIGEAAALEMIPWEPVDVTIYTLQSPPPQTIHRSLEDLTLDAIRHQDESSLIIDGETLKSVLDQINLHQLDNQPEPHTKKGGIPMAKDKLQKVLQQLSELSGYEGAAVISDEGLVMASHFTKDQPEDVVAALVQETVNMAQQVIDQAKWGKLDNLVLESEDDHKMILYRTRFGYVALFGNKKLNLGLARVAVDEAAEDLEH